MPPKAYISSYLTINGSYSSLSQTRFGINVYLQCVTINPLIEEVTQWRVFDPKS